MKIKPHLCPIPPLWELVHVEESWADGRGAVAAEAMGGQALLQTRLSQEVQGGLHPPVLFDPVGLQLAGVLPQEQEVSCPKSSLAQTQRSEENK